MACVGSQKMRASGYEEPDYREQEAHAPGLAIVGFQGDAVDERSRGPGGNAEPIDGDFVDDIRHLGSSLPLRVALIVAIDLADTPGRRARRSSTRWSWSLARRRFPRIPRIADQVKIADLATAILVYSLQAM